MLLWIILERIILIHLHQFSYMASTIYYKSISIGIEFLYFHCTSLHGLVCCTLNYNYYLFCLHLSHFKTDSSTTCTTVHPMHTLQTSTAIFRLMWLLKVTSECTLHSRVKDSTTQNSAVIYSSNFNFKGRLIC